jgi:hypothetical protein
MKKHTLKHPIEISDKKTITELPLRDYPVADDYLAYDNPGRNAQLKALIASFTNTDESIIAKMHGDDYKELAVYCDKLCYPEFYNGTAPKEATEIAAKKE